MASWEARMAERALERIKRRALLPREGHVGPDHSMVLIDRGGNSHVSRCSECGWLEHGGMAAIVIDDNYRRFTETQRAKGWPLDEDQTWTGPIATPDDWFYKWRPVIGEFYPRYLVEG